MRRGGIRIVFASGAVAVAVHMAGALAGQGVPPAPVEAPPPVVEPITPGGAFLRSVLIPGWGHVATGSLSRGGFYLTAQTASAWMLWKSQSRKRQAEALGQVERSVVEARLVNAGVTHPDSLRISVDAEPAVERWDDLVESRRQQVEDWVAASVFLVLLSAADAFVAAHLMDFPEPLTFEVLPRWGERSVDLGVRVPIPRRLGGRVGG